MPSLSLPGEFVPAAVALTAWAVFRTLQDGAFSNLRNALRWAAAGAGHCLALESFARTEIALAGPLAVLLILIWSTPLLTLSLFRSQRLLFRTRLALNRGDLRSAGVLLDRAAGAVHQSSPVDLEWGKIQLGELEGRLRMAEGRPSDAAPPLRESFLRALESGATCYLLETGALLARCYCELNQPEDARDILRQLQARGISLDSQATHAWDSGASVPAAPADTISSRTR